jgi:hypothetical protein
MWLKMLRRWLERDRPPSDEQYEAQFRSQRERQEFELRKAEVITSYFPPRCR